MNTRYFTLFREQSMWLMCFMAVERFRMELVRVKNKSSQRQAAGIARQIVIQALPCVTDRKCTDFQPCNHHSVGQASHCFVLFFCMAVSHCSLCMPPVCSWPGSYVRQLARMKSLQKTHANNADTQNKQRKNMVLEPTGSQVSVKIII